MQCAKNTLIFYKNTAGVFLNWVEEQGITSPEQVNARLVRHYLAELATKGKADKTLHAHARAIRTLLRFWYSEKYIPEPVIFAMPKTEKKRLPCLSADELNQVLSACKNPRDKALILFMADSGLRRAEAIDLNWEDVDIMSGLVRVKRETRKGKKSPKRRHRCKYTPGTFCISAHPRKSKRRFTRLYFPNRRPLHRNRGPAYLSSAHQKDRHP